MGCPSCGAEYPQDHEPDCQKKLAEVKAGVKRSYCDCGGTGVRKIKDARGVWTRRYEKCDCGRMVNCSGALKLARQAQLDERMEVIRKGVW
jgi:hypothetical protein